MAETPFPEVDTATPDLAAPPTPDPQDVANEFLAAAASAGEESGIVVKNASKRRRGAAEPDAISDDALPKWTPDGIGTAATFLANFGLMRAGMIPLEPAEEKKVAVVVPMYLNYRVPKAAKIQPEVMIVSLLAEILGPRIAARVAAARAAETPGMERAT